MNKVIDVFLQLVKINSPSRQEQGMISFITNWLKQHNLAYKLDKVGNVFVYIKGDGDPILFCVHMDTVEPGKGIKPIIKNGTIKSSGSTILGADNKGTIASLLTAVEKYLNQVKNPRSFELLFTVKEETGGGVEFFPAKWIKSKIGFVFDSANPLGGIVLRSPFIINFHAEFIGKAAHSSVPMKGKNALVVAMKALNNIPCGEVDNGETTINVGQINGGTGINIIPEKISLSGEVRSYKQSLFNKNLTKIKTNFLNIAKKKGIKLNFKTDGFCPGYCHDKKSLFIQKIKEMFLLLNLKSIFYNYSGVSDANILNSKGIKTINLADGVIKPHITKEQIKIKTLMSLQQIILCILRRKLWGG